MLFGATFSSVAILCFLLALLLKSQAYISQDDCYNSRQKQYRDIELGQVHRGMKVRLVVLLRWHGKEDRVDIQAAWIKNGEDKPMPTGADVELEPEQEKNDLDHAHWQEACQQEC